jgi:hypothetical protein
MYLAAGWYVVKNPASRNVLWDESREQEQTFFSNPPWSLEDTAHHGRLGTVNLADALSNLLNQQIARWFVSIDTALTKSSPA